MRIRFEKERKNKEKESLGKVEGMDK